MDHNNNHHHSGGGFMNGFLLGVIVGAAVVFLLATKKGKQILKTLTENGFEGVSELSDLISSVDDDEAYEEEYVAEEESEPVSHVSKPHISPRPLKRLFRRVKK